MRSLGRSLLSLSRRENKHFEAMEKAYDRNSWGVVSGGKVKKKSLGISLAVNTPSQMSPKQTVSKRSANRSGQWRLQQAWLLTQTATTYSFQTKISENTRKRTSVGTKVRHVPHNILKSRSPVPRLQRNIAIFKNAQPNQCQANGVEMYRRSQRSVTSVALRTRGLLRLDFARGVVQRKCR